MLYIVYFGAWIAFFSLLASGPQIIAAAISIRHGIKAHSQRRKGIFLPLLTYKEQIKLVDAKWDAFFATFIGKLIVYVFCGIMIFAFYFVANSYVDPNEWIIRAQFPK